MAKNDPFLDPFFGPKVPGFQGFCLKNRVKNDPLIDLLWSVPGSQGPRTAFSAVIPNKRPRKGVKMGQND
jgi:hypothetical protein